jgi:hypothetical protein
MSAAMDVGIRARKQAKIINGILRGMRHEPVRVLGRSGKKCGCCFGDHSLVVEVAAVELAPVPVALAINPAMQSIARFATRASKRPSRVGLSVEARNGARD